MFLNGGSRQETEDTMRLRRFVYIFLVTIAACEMAHAQYVTYGPPPSDGILRRLVILGIVAAVIYALCLSVNALDSFISDLFCKPSPPSNTELAQRYEEDAARLRAQKRKTDAHTELTASLIDKARVDAEYDELKQITDHDRKVRNIHRNGQ